jgi:hypothetical protein
MENLIGKRDNRNANLGLNDDEKELKRRNV